MNAASERHTSRQGPFTPDDLRAEQSGDRVAAAMARIRKALERIYDEPESLWFQLVGFAEGCDGLEPSEIKFLAGVLVGIENGWRRFPDSLSPDMVLHLFDDAEHLALIQVLEALLGEGAAACVARQFILRGYGLALGNPDDVE
jgi:hypothetical protein